MVKYSEGSDNMGIGIAMVGVFLILVVVGILVLLLSGSKDSNDDSKDEPMMKPRYKD